jgi:hypothetical protein
MDALTKFEQEFGKPRSKWSKAEWRRAALALASIPPDETRGRPKKTGTQKYESEQTLRAAEFWRDQAIEMESVPDGDVDKLVELRGTPLVDGVVGMVINRKDKLNQNTATKALIVETLTRVDSTPNLDEKDKKQVRKIRAQTGRRVDALVRAIQMMQKNRREK